MEPCPAEQASGRADATGAAQASGAPATEAQHSVVPVGHG